MHLKPSNWTMRSFRRRGAGGGARGGFGKDFSSINAHYHIKSGLPNFNCGCLWPCGVKALLERCGVNLRTEGPTGLMSLRPPESGVAAALCHRTPRRWRECGVASCVTEDFNEYGGTLP